MSSLYHTSPEAQTWPGSWVCSHIFRKGRAHCPCWGCVKSGLTDELGVTASSSLYPSSSASIPLYLRQSLGALLALGFPVSGQHGRDEQGKVPWVPPFLYPVLSTFHILAGLCHLSLLVCPTCLFLARGRAGWSPMHLLDHVPMDVWTVPSLANE